MPSNLTFADLAPPVTYTHHACRNGVEVLTNTKVESIDGDALTLVRQDSEGKHSQTVAYGACVWATGVAMPPLSKHLQEAKISPYSGCGRCRDRTWYRKLLRTVCILPYKKTHVLEEYMFMRFSRSPVSIYVYMHTV